MADRPIVEDDRIRAEQCVRCGRQGAEEVEEFGWLEAPHELGPLGVLLICPGCQSLEEDVAATAAMQRALEELGGGMPALVNAEIQRVADRQCHARALDEMLGVPP